MIKPLTLGNKTFPVNLIQGPLAGISCAPFRELTWKHSAPAFSCTEMMSCKTLLHQKPFSYRRFVSKSSHEGPVCFQLASNNPLELAEAVKIVTDQGADLIDLNCGCPVKKIRSKGAGSSLLMQPQKLYQLITAMKKNTHLPVSIKIRVEGNSQDKFHDEIIKVVTDAGLDFLIVHGRHWTEHYETPCNHDHIKYFVNNLKIPVIGNGDIACIHSLKKMLATGCAGAMVGRAGVGQPWLIGQLKAEIQQQTFVIPTSQQIGAMFIHHVEQLILLLDSEKFALIQARKFAKYYARHLSTRIEFADRINVSNCIKELKNTVLAHF